MIKFEELELKQLHNFNGGDGVFLAKMQVDELNKILKGCLEKNCSIGEHRHENGSEIIYVLSGEGVSVVDGCAERVVAGDCIYCKKGSAHSLKNEGEQPLIFFAVVANQ